VFIVYQTANTSAKGTEIIMQLHEKEGVTKELITNTKKKEEVNK
jgi:hypothetical protein